MYNFIFLYYGLLSMVTQLVSFRELSVLFYGNELFLGTFLCSWLFWSGLGSLLARRLSKKEHYAAAHFSYGFLAISLLFPAMILSIRASKSVFAFGELIGPVGTILYTFGIMSVLCFVIGSQFSLACALGVLGRVYMYESLGAVIAGALFTYILIGSVPTFVIALALSLGCVLVSLALLIRKISFRNALLMITALIILFIDFRLEPAINKIEWKRYQFIKQKETRNDTLTLANMGSIKNVFANGMLAASFPNPENYEPSAHWPLLAGAKSDQILVIGESSLGILKEALKHTPKSVDYVMLDSSFLDLVKGYLEPEDISALEDERVKIHYADSRIFLRNNKNKYDAVIINIQDVPNLKTNRFYTQEFYKQVKLILKPGGILGLGVASSENYLSEQARMFNASVYHTLKSVFKTVEVIPGDTVMFLSSASAIDMQKSAILGRFNSRNLSNHYLVPSFIEHKLEVRRRLELRKLLEETTGAMVNRDFRPTTYYYFANFWLNKFASPLGFLVLGIFVTAISLVLFNKKTLLVFLARKKESVLIFALGFISILLELVLLLAYQIISGYIYWQMGVLFASFMLGLFLGSFLGNQFRDYPGQRHSVFLATLSVAIAGLCSGAACLLSHCAHLSAIQNMFIFISLLTVGGVVVGAAFVVAGFLIGGNEITVKAGSLYASDLWGASLGAMVSTNLIVPVFGILGALNFSAAIGLAGFFIFLILSGRRSR